MNYPFYCPKCGVRKIISMPIKEYTSEGHKCECGFDMKREPSSLVCGGSIDNTGTFFRNTTI